MKGIGKKGKRGGNEEEEGKGIEWEEKLRGVKGGRGVEKKGNGRDTTNGRRETTGGEETEREKCI